MSKGEERSGRNEGSSDERVKGEAKQKQFFVKNT
jgi:hypothetical protein